MADPGAVFISTLRVIGGFVLLLFLPGFALTLVYFPEKTDLDIPDRLVLSGILSIGLVIFTGITMDVVLGVDTTPRNIALAVSAAVVLMLILWRLSLKCRRFTCRKPGSFLIPVRGAWHRVLQALARSRARLVDRIRKSQGRNAW